MVEPSLTKVPKQRSEEEEDFYDLVATMYVDHLFQKTELNVLIASLASSKEIIADQEAKLEVKPIQEDRLLEKWNQRMILVHNADRTVDSQILEKDLKIERKNKKITTLKKKIEKN